MSESGDTGDTGRADPAQGAPFRCARRVLGVGPNADSAEIRGAYRQQMRSLHPDRSGDDSTDNRGHMNELAQAYRLLLSARTVETAADGLPEPMLQPEASVDPPDVFEAGPQTRLLQTAFATAIVVTSVVLVLFFLVAFSQSGR